MPKEFFYELDNRCTEKVEEVRFSFRNSAIAAMIICIVAPAPLSLVLFAIQENLMVGILPYIFAVFSSISIYAYKVAREYNEKDIEGKYVTQRSNLLKLITDFTWKATVSAEDPKYETLGDMVEKFINSRSSMTTDEHNQSSTKNNDVKPDIPKTILSEFERELHSKLTPLKCPNQIFEDAVKSLGGKVLDDSAAEQSLVTLERAWKDLEGSLLK